jgi:glycosyltransferase involved in cell wall biosynthesis
MNRNNRVKNIVNNPILSIVIPHYNHAQELPALLQSICEQDFKELEVIVVDDCSEMPCDDVVAAFVAKGLPVRMIQSAERLFTKNARLLGVRHAQGEIIACADCDDVFCTPASLGVHISRFLAEEPDILHFTAVRRAEIDSHISPFAEYLEGSEIFTQFLRAYRCMQIHRTLWGKLYMRELWLQIVDVAWNMPVKRYSEDICLTSLLMFHARRYVGSILPAYIYHYPSVVKIHAEAMERAVYSYIMLTRMVPYFAANGCSETALRDFAWMQSHDLCMYLGRFCKHAYEDTGFLPDEILDAMLELADSRTWMKILALGNGKNAAKLVSMARTLYDVDENPPDFLSQIR